MILPHLAAAGSVSNRGSRITPITTDVAYMEIAGVKSVVVVGGGDGGGRAPCLRFI